VVAVLSQNTDLANDFAEICLFAQNCVADMVRAVCLFASLSVAAIRFMVRTVCLFESLSVEAIRFMVQAVCLSLRVLYHMYPTMRACGLWFLRGVPVEDFTRLSYLHNITDANLTSTEANLKAAKSAIATHCYEALSLRLLDTVAKSNRRAVLAKTAKLYKHKLAAANNTNSNQASELLAARMELANANQRISNMKSALRAALNA
jgi:hypothetical protein